MLNFTSASATLSLRELNASLAEVNAQQRAAIINATQLKVPEVYWRMRGYCVTVDNDCPLWMAGLLREILTRYEDPEPHGVPLVIGSGESAVELVLHDIPVAQGNIECLHLFLRTVGPDDQEIGGYFGPAKKLLIVTADGNYGFPGLQVRTDGELSSLIDNCNSPLFLYAERDMKLGSVCTTLIRLGLKPSCPITVFPMTFQRW